MKSNKKNPSISIDKPVLKLTKFVRARKVFDLLLHYLTTNESKLFKTNKIIKCFSEKYKLNFNSLKSRYYRRVITKLKTHNNQLMEDRVEKYLAVSLSKLASLGVPMNRSDIVSYARLLLNKPLEWQGSKWFMGFMKRQSHIISERKVRQVTASRMRYDKVVPIQDFIDRYTLLKE